MNRPHSDDLTINNDDKEPTTTEEPLTIKEQSTHKLSKIEGEKTSIEATLHVTSPSIDKLHTEKGEQSVLSVTIVNGNIDLRFHQTTIPALIDTGATISCMREDLASTLSKQYPTEYVRVRLRVFLADGAMCHITKAIKIKFKIKNKIFSHQFALLKSLTQPVILGTDFLSRTKSTIQYSLDPTPITQPIRATRSVTIQPFTETAVTGQVTCMHSVAQINGVTDNLDRNKTAQYIVQRSVVTPDSRNKHPIILMNISNRPYKIQKGEIIGVYTKTTVNKNTKSIVTQYEDTNLEIKDGTLEDRTVDIDSDTESDNTMYIPSPARSIYSESENEGEISDDEANINFMNTEDDLTDTSSNSKEHKFIKPDCLTELEFEEFSKLLNEFDDIFVGKDNKLGRTHLYTHKIELIPDAKPMQFYPFRMAPHKAELLESECKKLVAQNILEETNTGPWSSRSFLVEKKGGQGYRLVTDLRYVNSQTINQALTSPRADDSIEMIGEMKPVIFSKMDAQQGYFQIPIREEDRDKVAFLTRTKKYRYKAMPMGLATSAQAFQAVINLILQNLQYKCAIPYLDDILCLSPSIKQHFIDLRDIFTALRKGNLKLKKTKCEFFLEELEFLGMRVTVDGIKPSPEKVAKIQSFPTPKSVKDVRSFTGLAQFYRKFIKGFSEIARPLFDLLQNNTTFQWSDTCKIAFQKLKDSICNDAILLYPDYQKTFHLTTDASGVALGATLSQENKEGVLQPVAFGGRSLHEHEKNYGATQREMLGVVFAVEYFRHYLEGKHFELYTDHQALVHMLTKSDNKHMWARWALKIQQFSFTIKHLKGKLNIPSDAMSRREYPLEEKPMTEPPPKPKTMRVQYRVFFKEDTTTQFFEKEDPPNTLFKLLPRAIYKPKSTHHFYCPCPTEEIKPDTTTGEAGTFQTLIKDADKPVKHVKARISAINTEPDPCNTHLVRDTLETTKGRVQTNYIDPSDTATIEYLTPWWLTPRPKAPASQANQCTNIDTKDTVRTIPGRTPPCLGNQINMTPINVKQDAPIKNKAVHALIPLQTDHIAAVRTIPGRTPPPQTITPKEVQSELILPETKTEVTVRAIPGRAPPTHTATHKVRQLHNRPPRDATHMAEHLRKQTKEIMELIEQLADPQVSILQLKREQKKSPTINPIINYIENDQVPAGLNKKDTDQFVRRAQDHMILEGILVHINTTLWRKHQEFSFQPVIPEEMRFPILKLFHDIPMAGHAGAQRMLSTMLPKVYWKGMATDVQKFTASCHICLKSKKMNTSNVLPMTKHDQPSYPFQFINMDAIGPLPQTPGKNKYIQVVVDRFSKFCIAYPTTTLDAVTTSADFIENVILAEGAPTNMQTDNATSYKNSTFRSMCSTFSIKHVFGSPYRPKSNGQAERYVKTISEGLRAFCMEHQDTWDVMLPYLVFSINNTESATTGYTPFFVMKGRNPNSVVENKLAIEEEKSLQLHIIDNLKRVDYTFNKVIINSEKKTEQMRKQHDKRAKETMVKKESLVYVRIPRLLDREKCLKLQEVFAGPYIVCKFISKTSVILKSIITMKLAPKPVHVDRLKLVRHVRNNDFIHRLIDPNDDLINKLWKTDGKAITPKPILLQTTNIYKPRPAHSKVRKRTRTGLRP